MLELLHHHHHHAGSTNALSGPLAWKVLFQRRRRNSPCRDMGIKLAFNGCAHCTRSLSTLRISSPVHSYTSALTLPTTMHGKQFSRFCFTSIHPSFTTTTTTTPANEHTKPPILQLRGMQKYPFQKATGNQFACSLLTPPPATAREGEGVGGVVGGPTRSNIGATWPIFFRGR